MLSILIPPRTRGNEPAVFLTCLWRVLRQRVKLFYCLPITFESRSGSNCKYNVLTEFSVIYLILYFVGLCKKNTPYVIKRDESHITMRVY